MGRRFSLIPLILILCGGIFDARAQIVTPRTPTSKMVLNSNGTITLSPAAQAWLRYDPTANRLQSSENAGPWLTLAHEVGLNVMDFGAAGNGTSDDTGAFTAAANALGSNGGTILVPNKKFACNIDMTGYRNITIRGVGGSGKASLLNSYLCPYDPTKATITTGQLDTYGATGTGTISSSGSAVTGSGTNFNTIFASVGTGIMFIRAAGQTVYVTSKSSDTALVTTSAFSPPIAGGTAFTYGIDLDQSQTAFGNKYENLTLYATGPGGQGHVGLHVGESSYQNEFNHLAIVNYDQHAVLIDNTGTHLPTFFLHFFQCFFQDDAATTDAVVETNFGASTNYGVTSTYFTQCIFEGGSWTASTNTASYNSGNGGFLLLEDGTNNVFIDDSYFEPGSDTSVTKTGTFTTVGTAVTGSGSAFDTEFAKGDILTVKSGSNQLAKNRIITATPGSATSMTINSAFASDITVGANVGKGYTHGVNLVKTGHGSNPVLQGHANNLDANAADKVVTTNIASYFLTKAVTGQFFFDGLFYNSNGAYTQDETGVTSNQFLPIGTQVGSLFLTGGSIYWLTGTQDITQNLVPTIGYASGKMEIRNNDTTAGTIDLYPYSANGVRVIGSSTNPTGVFKVQDNGGNVLAINSLSGATAADTIDIPAGATLAVRDNASTSTFKIGVQTMRAFGGVQFHRRSFSASTDTMSVSNIGVSNGYDYLVSYTGSAQAVTETLPAAASTPSGSASGLFFIFKDESGNISPTNPWTITPASGEKIDNVADGTYKLTTPYGFVAIYSNGTSWWTIGPVQRLSRQFSTGTALVSGDVAATSGWGSGPTVNTPTAGSTDVAGQLSILSGTAPTGPEVTTLIFHDLAWNKAPFCTANVDDNGSTVTAVTGVLTHTTTTSLAIKINGALTGAQTYLINYICRE